MLGEVVDEIMDLLHILARVVFAYVVLLVIVRVSGKRTPSGMRLHSTSSFR
jgi:uncharacterized membrane protein YcaP (DUF421 family)